MFKKNEAVWAIGLMSGTSLDGIDAALIRTDGESADPFGPWLTVPYDDAFRTRLRAAVRGEGDMLKAERDLTLHHANIVKQLLDHAGMKPADIRVVGFHGQTVAHRPKEGLTWQIGDGALLAEKTKIDVICDFRRRDVAAGGEGAPLVPLYHAALAHGMKLPVAVLNIGGISNVSWIGRSESVSDTLLDMDIMAMDTGPGNAMLNDWVHMHAGLDYDEDGALANQGNVNEVILEALMNDPYFHATPPKSLDRNHFSLSPLKGLSIEDGAATLTAFTAKAAAHAQRFFPSKVERWFVTGGGRHNPVMMKMLRDEMGYVSRVEKIGWNGDALEAQAFAFLAVRSLYGLVLSLPTTTGAGKVVTGGAYHKYR